MTAIGKTWMTGPGPMFAFLLCLALYHPPAPAAELYDRTEPAMGALARLVVEANDERAATRALNAAFARIREIELRLSDYLDTSEARQLELAPLNTPIPVSEDLFRVLQHGLLLARQTRGAFDPTLGRATRAWRSGGPETPPTGNHRHIELGPQTVTLRAPGIAFDFGGIAKGYAADEALKVLRQHGFPRAMAALSGDIALGAPPSGRQGWRVGLGSPDQIEELAHCGVSTSGDANQTRQGHSHIFDGRSAQPRPARPGAVTVVAPSAMEADALATAIHALGKEEAEKVLPPKTDIRVVFRLF